jgi:hypothetical protein
MNKNFKLLICCLLFILVGCSSFSNEEFYTEWDFSTPTRDTSVVQEKLKTPTKTITQPPTATADTPKSTQSEVTYQVVYTEDVNPNWGVISGSDEEINLRSQAESLEGFLSIAFTPTKAYSNITFVVDDDTRFVYPISKILGVRFWINPEDYDLNPSILSFKIEGSNQNTYFENNRVSSNFEDPNPSETTLDVLGYTEPIPAKSWTELVILLENLEAIPDYTNLIGFSFINNSGFLQTIYLDKVELILAAGEIIPTREPTATATATPIPPNTATSTPTATATSTPTKSQITPYWTPTPTKTEKPNRPKPTKKVTPTLAP